MTVYLMQSLRSTHRRKTLMLTQLGKEAWSTCMCLLLLFSTTHCSL